MMKSDLEIVEDVRSGNRAAFANLVQRHQKGLLRLAMRFVRDLEIAEDVVQESFIKSYQKLSTFCGQSSFKSWLYQIAINTAKNKLRERRQDLVNIENVHLAVSAMAESQLVNRDVKEMIRLQINKLPFKQKTAVILRVYEDLSFKEIAQIMECPYDTAKANYRHGLMKLRYAMASIPEVESLWSEVNSPIFMESEKIMEAEQ